MENVIVLKFGGTSVSSRDSVQTIASEVERCLKLGNRPVLVVSALSGVTEQLLGLLREPSKRIPSRLQAIRITHEKIINELFSEAAHSAVTSYVNTQLSRASALAKRKTRNGSVSDEVASLGEIMSSYLIAEFLKAQGINAKQVIATGVIATDDNFTNAEFIPARTIRNARTVLTPLLRGGIVPVVTGFIGASPKGKTTTLGRGGSDYSASIIGHALDAEEIQIWTDVDGIFTADPRHIKNTVLIPGISYREASEMAAFGAKVLHPRTIKPAVEKRIPVRVLNTFNPDSHGSIVSYKSGGSGLKAIAFKKSVTLITVYSDAMLFSRGFLARIFNTFAEHNISVDLVSVSEVSVSVTLDNNEHVAAAVRKLEKFATVSVHKEGFGVISLIGEKIAESKSLLDELFPLLTKLSVPLRMISMGASDINVSIVIPAREIVRTANALHNHFIVSKNTV